MQTFDWAAEELVAAHPGLYLEHCAVMAAALMTRHSARPCEFLVECDGFRPPVSGGQDRFLLRVSWSDAKASKAARVWETEQPRAVIERAAVALAALTFGHLVPDGQMRVTRVGDRADYWLPRLKCALEISGTEHLSEVPRCHRQKVVQVLQNPLRWNGFVYICCFVAPRGQIRWTFVQQEQA